MSFHVRWLPVFGLIACGVAAAAWAGESSIFDDGDSKAIPTDKDEVAVYEKQRQAVLVVGQLRNSVATQEEALKKTLDTLVAEKKAAFAKEDLDAASAAQAKIEAKRKELQALGQVISGKEEVVKKIRELRDQVRQTATAKKNALMNENLEEAKAYKEKIEGLKAEAEAQLRLLAPPAQEPAQAAGNAGAPQVGAAEGFAVFKDREIEVAATNGQGVSLGKVEKGSLVTVGYVKGEWSWGNIGAEAPTKEGIDGRYRVVLVGWSGTAQKIICEVHPKLLEEVFSLRITGEFDRICLRINDTFDQGAYGDNSGSCKFKVSLLGPKQGMLKPGVLDDKKRWFRGFWQRYDNGSAMPWGPIWCFSAGGDAVARNRDGSKAIDLGDWTMDCYGEITYEEGGWRAHVFVDSVRKAHGYYIKQDDGSMILFELKSWAPPKPAEFHPVINVGR